MRKFKEKFEFGRSKYVVIFAGELDFFWRDYESKNPKLIGVLEYLRIDFIYSKTDILLVIFDDQVRGTHNSHLPHAIGHSFSNDEAVFNYALELRKKDFHSSYDWEQKFCIYEKWAAGLTFPYATVNPEEVKLAKDSRE